MPILHISQPETLPVSPALRLRRFDPEEDFSFALSWYQDPETVRLVDGPEAKPYDLEKLGRMYTYLNAHGELYWIEERQGSGFAPIGDVTLCPEDLPIVIGPSTCRGRGVGKLTVTSLVKRAKALGWDHLAVREIYRYNAASQGLFRSLGFYEIGETEEGKSYRLEL